MYKCNYILAWTGLCKNEVEEKGTRCPKHKDEKCRSCGEPATHQCSETMGLVCGAPLCDDCEHTICENGCNSQAPRPEGLGTHCKKTEQVYKPWYIQDYIDKHGQEAYEELLKGNPQ